MRPRQAARAARNPRTWSSTRPTRAPNSTSNSTRWVYEASSWLASHRLAVFKQPSRAGTPVARLVVGVVKSAPAQRQAAAADAAAEGIGKPLELADPLQDSCLP